MLLAAAVAGVAVGTTGVGASVTHSAVGNSSSNCPSADLTHELFASHLNLSLPALAAVKTAYDGGDLEEACAAIATYFETAATAGSWWRLPSTPPPSSRMAGGSADNALNDKYDFYGEIGVVPRNASNSYGLEWMWLGPVGDLQFPIALSRHAIFSSLVAAWNATGNAVYPRLFDNITTDWVTNVPPPADGSQDTRGLWMTLEPGIRMSASWPQGFLGFQRASHNDWKVSTRVAMLASVAQHGVYLAKYGSSGNPNFRSMQWHGLGNIGLLFPEFLQAKTWYAEAVKGVRDDIAVGVYPDGVETEQTSGYHVVATTNFNGLADTTLRAGRALDPVINTTLLKMFGYIAYSLDPVGYPPLNSDSDLSSNAKLVLDAAKEFGGQPEWVYVATQGARGTVPAGSPTRMFPWTGQFITRSGWDAGAQWGWLDVGPYGSSGHGHRDKLHLSVRVGAQHLLVDSGRFAYEGSMAKQFHDSYAQHTRGHNTLLVDGAQQVNGPAVATAPLQEGIEWGISNDTTSAGAVDWAFGSIFFDGLPPSTVHTRGVAYVRGAMWVVVDRLSAAPRAQAHAVESLWHVHPSCDVSLVSAAGARVTANATAASPGTGLDIAVAAGAGWHWTNATVVEGQLTPAPQGWYSPHYDTAVPSPALVLSAAVGGTSAVTAGASASSSPPLASMSFAAFSAYAIVPFMSAPAVLPSVRIVNTDASSATVEVATAGGEPRNVTVAVGAVPSAAVL